MFQVQSKMEYSFNQRYRKIQLYKSPIVFDDDKHRAKSNSFVKFRIAIS